jgi:hypothetical protein
MLGVSRFSNRPEWPAPADGFVPRRVLPTEDAKWPFGQERPTDDLETLIDERVSRVINETGSKSRVLLGFVVEARDGMTRDAERARAIISGRVGPNWRVRFVSADESHPQGPLTELSALFGGTRPIMRAAQASGLVPGRAKDWIWSLSMVLLAAVLSVAATLVSHLAAHLDVYSGTAIGAAVGVAVLSTAATGLKAGGLPVFGYPAMKRLEKAVTATPADTDADINFGRQLVQELTHERGSVRELSRQKRDRAVVIDDYGRLWPRTSRLIEQYIRTLPEEALVDPDEERPEEFWVVFDRGSLPESEQIQRSTGHITDLKTFGSFLAWTCRQQELDSVQKRRLVRRLERGALDRNDRRLRYRRIGDILSGAKDATTEQELLIRLRDDGDSTSILSFSFLAFAASVASPPPLRPAEIVKAVFARDGSSPDPLRDLIHAWFPEVDRPGPLSDALKTALEPFSALFEEREKHDQGVRVDAGWADAFTRSYSMVRREHGLPLADGAHAFWALFWRGQLDSPSSWSAPVVERMIGHLRALREPASVSHRYGEHVARALCEAALFGAHAALALCVPGIAPSRSTSKGSTEAQEGLVDCAFALISEGAEPQDEAFRESLLDSAWALYMLTSHSSLLNSILSVESPADRTSDERLIDLYLESLVGGSKRLPSLPDRSSPSSEAVQDHARVRALWLAATLEPLTIRANSHWLSAITDRSDETLVGVVTRTVERMTPGRDDLFASIDCATLLVASLWCSFKETCGHPASDALTAAFDGVGRTILQARDERRASSVRTDFVLNGLLETLLAAVSTKPNELADLHGMWRSLELNELADLAGLCCNVYAAGDPNLRFRDDAKILVGLGGVEDRPINLVESELIAGIMRLGASLRSGASLIVEAGCIAIEAQLGEGFAFELSKLLVVQNLTIIYDKREQLLEHAIDTPAGHQGILDVPDSELEVRVTALLNCLSDPKGAVAELLAKVIADRRALIHDPWIEDHLDQSLEYYHVGHNHAPAEDDKLLALLARWRTRVWEPGLPPSIAETEKTAVTQTPQGLALNNSNSCSDASVMHVYDFLDNGQGGSLSTATRDNYLSRTRYMYAYILVRTWDGVDRLGGALLDDAIRLLSEDLPVTREGYVLLANCVSAQLAKRELTASSAFGRAITIQRSGIATAQAALSPTTNYRVYSELVQHDPQSRADHQRNADNWQYEEHRLAQEQLFLQFEGRHYFEIFWYHHLRPPEPPCNLDDAAIRTPYESLPSETPEPLLFDESGEVVAMSGEFLRLGYEVFRLRPKQSGSEKIRAEISSLARCNVRPLYELLMGRDTVSPSVRELYEEQLKRFDELEL